jgi:hypothetical protein
MGRARGMHAREKTNAGIWLESLKDRNHLKHLGIGGMMLFN